MAKYYVRDVQGYVTVIEADRYSLSNHWVFEFVSEVGDAVASFPMNTTLSVVEADTAFQDTFPHDEAEIEDDPNQPEDCRDENCLDCRLEDFLNSEEFITAVAEIAADVVQEFWGSPEPPPPETLPVLTVLKAVDKKDEEVCYGFVTEGGAFVDFSTEANAKNGLKRYKDDVGGWIESGLANYTFSKIEPEVPQLTVLKGVRKNGQVEHGFLTPGGFVNYIVGPESDAECIEMAKEGLSDYLGRETGWSYEKPEDYTFTEVENG
jgi:hypothetical protein